MSGQEKCDLLIQVIAWAGLTSYIFTNISREFVMYKLLFVMFQDLQAEVDANKGTYDSLNTAGNQLTRTMVAADAQRLQRRLEEMNQRWVNLMTKSMEIRYKQNLSHVQIKKMGKKIRLEYRETCPN